MKTTLDIDQELLKQAKEALNAATIKETVRASLEAVVRQRKLRALADAFGSVAFDMSPEDLRTQRRKRSTHHGPRCHSKLQTVDWTIHL